MGASEHVLNRLVLELRYREGIVYLDRCGSLTVALERALGKPFRNSVSPNMSHGEFSSIMENLTVRYGPQSFQVDQTWLETPVRFEKVAPLAWSEVAKTLDVQSKVTRCGLRLLVMWKVANAVEGQKRLADSGLIAETVSWAELMGKPKTVSFTGVSERGGLRLRANLDTVEVRTEGRFLPEDEKFIFDNALQLDLDYGTNAEGVFAREKLQSFIRTSLNDATNLIEGVSEVLYGR